MKVEHVSGFLIIGDHMVKFENIVSVEPESNEKKLNDLGRLEKVLPAGLLAGLAEKMDKPEPAFYIDIVVVINTKQSTASRIEFKTKPERDEVLKAIRDKIAN